MISEQANEASTPSAAIAKAIGDASGQLRVDVANGTAVVEISRPRSRNALSFAVWSALARVFSVLASNGSIDVVILRGTAGGPFSSGADITEFGTLRSDPEGARSYSQAVEAGGRAIMSCPKVTIAMVEGFAIGGGCEIALACDLRLCDETARFGITPAKLGLVYGLQSTRRLVETVGTAWARWMLFTGLHLDAATALRIGLVHQVHQTGELEVVTTALATRVSGLARVSITAAKALINMDAPTPADEEQAARLIDASISSPEYAEGVAAFLAKRRPDFRGARSSGG